MQFSSRLIVFYFFFWTISIMWTDCLCIASFLFFSFFHIYSAQLWYNVIGKKFRWNLVKNLTNAFNLIFFFHFFPFWFFFFHLLFILPPGIKLTAGRGRISQYPVDNKKRKKKKGKDNWFRKQFWLSAKKKKVDDNITVERKQKFDRILYFLLLQHFGHPFFVFLLFFVSKRSLDWFRFGNWPYVTYCWAQVCLFLSIPYVSCFFSTFFSSLFFLLSLLFDRQIQWEKKETSFFFTCCLHNSFLTFFISA